MQDIILGDCLAVLPMIPMGSVDLIYIDPPFNTGKTQTKLTQRFWRSNKGGSRFGGRQYDGEVVGKQSYSDKHENYLEWMYEIISNCRSLLKDTGSMYLHVDYREVHYLKVIMDEIFGGENFLNEIIWAWDYGARTEKRWPTKHNNILWYGKTNEYYFDIQQCDRIEYLAPKLVGAEKAGRGKFPTDVFWGTIVPTNGKEKTGWPNQKPEWLLNRLLATSCPPNGLVLDCFAGSGTTGAVAQRLGMGYILVEQNTDAYTIAVKRLKGDGGNETD